MNLESRYYGWEAVASSRAYRVQRMDDELLRRNRGALAADWPSDYICVADIERYHRTPVLPDHLANHGRRLIVSERLKSALERNGVANAEYLRLKVIDPTGQLLSPSYFIVRFLNAPACLDLEKSGATRSRVLPSKAEKVERLAFTRDPALALFQPEEFNKVTLISKALAEALAVEGFSGFRFMGLFDFGIHGDLPPHPARRAVDVLCERLWRPKAIS